MLLFDWGRRHWNLRFVQAVCAFLACVMLFLGYIATFMRSEVTGELLPPGVRWAAAIVMGLVGLLIFAAAIAYGGRCVSRIERKGDRVLIHTLGAFEPRIMELAIEEVTVGRRYAPGIGQSPHRNPPWRLLRIRGFRFPFVLDLQAPVIDETALLAINEAGGRGA